MRAQRKISPYLSLYVGALLCVSLFFIAFPILDMKIAELFFDFSEERFLLEHLKVVKLLRKIPILFYILACVLGAYLYIRNQCPTFLPLRKNVTAKSAGVLIILSLAIGPGLTVNLALKDYWGRPRPHEITYFNGAAPYVKPWRITKYCDKNCSFVSGEASGAAWFSIFAFLVSRRYVKKILAATGVFFLLVSFLRLAAGGHFISDILIGASLILLINYVLYRIIIPHPPNRLSS